jgi:hypothetical protein
MLPLAAPRSERENDSPPPSPYSITPMDLNTLANVVTTIAVVLGVGFGLVELRRAARDRRDRAAVEVVRSVQTQDIQRAVGLVMNLPRVAGGARKTRRRRRSTVDAD